MKIIYINRVKNAENEATKLNMLIDEYEKNYNLEILAEIINIYESNICGCDYLGMKYEKSLNLFNQHELFETRKVQQLLFDTIEYIKNIGDIDIKSNLFNQFFNILNNEQFKFDLLDDFNKKRKHTFDLLNEKLKIELENLRVSICSESDLTSQRNK